MGLSRAEVSRKIEEIIDFSELGDFIDVPMRTYSTGMQMRLAFSVSTIVRPQILLMDEWLSVGDEGFRHKAEKRLSELVQATEILVIASHSRSLIGIRRHASASIRPALDGHALSLMVRAGVPWRLFPMVSRRGRWSISKPNGGCRPAASRSWSATCLRSFGWRKASKGSPAL
ncbi:hypothetical protein [Pantoea ananatis]|uniref:hypothetical protein n=1 Tax=Pantoea ananas TaxID=553 RepID=UPI0039B9139F